MKITIEQKKIAAILGVLFMTAGCFNTFYQENRIEPAAEPLTEAEDYEVIMAREDGESKIWKSEHGTLSVGAEFTLPEKAEQVVFSYMECYYETVSALEMTDPDDLFADGESGGLSLNKNAWKYLIQLRKMQYTDLKLTGYGYDLSVEEARILNDKSLLLCLNENSTQQFAAHPGIDSELYHIRHLYLLVQQEGEWKICGHVQSDGIYQNILGEYWEDDLENLMTVCGEIPEAEAYFSEQRERLLTLSRENRDLRKDAYGYLELPKAQHTYNATAAVSYADSWVDQRNELWSDFTGQGGNCQNFVSQSLYAGGIPRDISGSDLWSWRRSDTNMPENEETTLTWINVEAFRQYALSNQGYGLSALVDAPYLEGEVGDVIEMGFPDRWSHTVLITKVITDEQGNTVDYLIHSNTADLKNFPVSAYSLPCQSLIKIVGWNV